MIFYYSGTGNSCYAAKSISDYLGDRAISMVKPAISGFVLKENERIGIVFPIHAWAPPKPVVDFIKRLELINYKGNYIYAVATCGKNIGNTMKVLEKLLRKRNFVLDSGFSLVMPNNYMLIGDVYDKEKETEILRDAEKVLANINAKIGSVARGVFEIEKGPMPWFLTNVINPGFRMYASRSGAFYATDACSGCGICEKACTSDNIKVDKKPVWGNNCTQCLACINYCPERAIEFGKSTINKGRYTNPNVGFNTLP